MIKTSHRTKRTFEQLALRKHADFERRLLAVARIEAVLPNVRNQHQAYFQEVIGQAEKWDPDSLERFASTAEGWMSTPELTGEALQRQAALDSIDCFGPPGFGGKIG